MSKKKKEKKGLERKITSLISSPALKEFNYKQIAFALGVNDTKGRNDIILRCIRTHNWMHFSDW